MQEKQCAEKKPHWKPVAWREKMRMRKNEEKREESGPANVSITYKRRLPSQFALKIQGTLLKKTVKRESENPENKNGRRRLERFASVLMGISAEV